MSNCEPTQSYKVPLKACRNSVIEHNLVTILLSVEWPEKGGDEPNLVIDITNKQPSTPCLQQNHPSVFVNSVHHQHHENVGSVYQQQYHHSSAMNNHDLTNLTTTNTIGDHNDFLSTTTTVICNSMQPQLQTLTSSAAIQKIKTDLKSQFSPIRLHQPPSNQQYPSSQNVIQTPSVNMNDSRLDMKMSTISPTSSLKTSPPVKSPYFDFSQLPTMPCPPSTPKTPPLKSLVCTCPNPTSYHVHNCAIYVSNNHESNANFSFEPMRRPSNNQINVQRPVFAPQLPATSAISVPPMKEPPLTTLVPFPNSNLMKTYDSTSSITTIISQPPSFSNNTQINSTIKHPSMNTDNSLQQAPLNFPLVIINNQSNFQTNPSISVPIVEQQNTNSRQRKKLLKERSSLTKQDQTLYQNSNNSQEQPNIKFSSLLTSPIQTQQGTFKLQDNSQITDNTLCNSVNETKLNTIQQSPTRPNPNVRSPVELDVSPSQNLNQKKVTSEDMDKTISEVIEGKVNISTFNSSTSTSPQQQQKQKPSLSSQLVWELNGPTTATATTYLPSLQQKQQSSTYDSNISILNHQNIRPITTQQVICPNFTEHNQMNILPTSNNNKKRNRSKSTNNSQSKRMNKPMINTRQQTTITSSVTSTSNLTNKPILWSDTPISTSSSGSRTITPIANPNQHLTTDLLRMPDIDHDSVMSNYSVFNDEQIQTIYPKQHHHGIELDDLFASKTDEFYPSTPPLLSMSASITNQILNSTSIEKLSNALIPSGTNPDDVYEEFFPSHLLTSSLTWEENDVVSSLLTRPNSKNNQLLQQQYYSQTDPPIDTNLQSQTLTSEFIETNSKIIKQMNNHDDIQILSKQQTKIPEKMNHQSNSIKNQILRNPSKISKQRNRPNSIQKQLSTKPICTRCGLTQLIDITHHEFPKQKGLVFECASCGNNSIRSNVSANERKRRLAKVAADHLNTVECQFCHKIFHCHNDYLIHLKDDHKSNKPIIYLIISAISIIIL